MRVLFTGGGTGGHFYPIISVAEELNKLGKENKLIDLELFYMAPSPYDAGVLYENNIIYKKNSAGKLRTYFSVLNFFDFFKTGWGILVSIIEIYRLYPDVVFGKGGYASFPALLASKLLRIPVVIHESDTVPGRVNLWAGKFAQRVAISYKEAAKFFPKERVAYTGQPVRADVAMPISTGAREFLKIEEDTSVLLILGGSQGAQKINEAVLGGLKQLVEKYAVIHQCGVNNFNEVKTVANTILDKSSYKERYKPFDYLNKLALRMSAGVASVVVSRAGSSIFEVAAWRVPAIIVPINQRVSRDQHTNAFAYARAGGCVVIEEDNLTPNILISEVSRLMDDEEGRGKMQEAAKQFFKPNAARLIAEEILKIALEHEVER